MADDRLARLVARARTEGSGPHEWAWNIDDVRWLINLVGGWEAQFRSKCRNNEALGSMIMELRADVATRQARIDEALLHHQPTGENLGTGAPYCTCDDLTDYPCPTRRALEGM